MVILNAIILIVPYVAFLPAAELGEKCSCVDDSLVDTETGPVWRHKQRARWVTEWSQRRTETYVNKLVLVNS